MPHNCIFLIGGHHFVPHLQSKIERHLGALRSESNIMYFAVTLQELLYCRIGLLLIALYVLDR